MTGGARRPVRSTTVLTGALLVVAASLPGGGCGEASGGLGAIRVDTLPSGVVQVRSSAAGVWGGESPWRASLRTRIGALEGEGPDVFGFVSGLAVDALGRIWVADRQAKELRVFDVDGAHVRTVGRPGGGPGEFGNPASVSAGPGGHLWVVDWGHQRISVFDTAGSLLREYRREGGGYGWMWRGGFDHQGRFVDLFVTAGRRGLLRYDLRMAPLDTLSLPESGSESEPFEVRYAAGGGRMMTVPYAPGTSWAFAPRGGFWFSPGSPYRLYRVDESLDTLRVVQREHRPVPVSQEERRRAEERVREFLGEEARVDLGRIPAEKPAVEWLAIDELGYLWVRPSLPSDAPPGTLDVFDPEGRYLGALVLPLPLGGDPLLIGAHRIVGVHRSELGVPEVVVMTLDRGPDAR